VTAWGVVTVCVDGGPLERDPGRYQGGVLVTDQRVNPISILVSFNAYPSLWRMVLLFAVLCVVGSIYICFPGEGVRDSLACLHRLGRRR
jgi:hypothetical protein